MPRLSQFPVSIQIDALPTCRSSDDRLLRRNRRAGGGGELAGAAVAAGVMVVRRRITDPLLETVAALIAPYVAYLLGGHRAVRLPPRPSYRARRLHRKSSPAAHRSP
jgi:hypothetical protein